MYHSLAQFYDRYMEDVSTEKWAEFAERYLPPCTKTHPAPLVLDVACGTGQLTCSLAEQGYDMIGLDCSAEMLAVAQENCMARGLENVLWVCQDMCRMNLYGTVAAVLCATDGVNHLTRKQDLSRFFRLVANYLDNEGVFLFDALTEHYFARTIGDNVFVDDSEEGTCLWMSHYQPKRQLCTYDITLYERLEDGTYERSDDRVVERAWTEAELRQCLEQAGLVVEGIYGSPEGRRVRVQDGRRWYVCRRPAR